MSDFLSCPKLYDIIINQRYMQISKINHSILKDEYVYKKYRRNQTLADETKWTAFFKNSDLHKNKCGKIRNWTPVKYGINAFKKLWYTYSKSEIN